MLNSQIFGSVVLTVAGWTLEGQMSTELAIDLGSSTTRIAEADGTILLEEPTVAAIDSDSGRLLAFGRDALGLGARSAGRIRIVHPVRNGKLVDVDLAETVLSEALSRCGIGRLERPRAVTCAHIDQTGVQERAIERALKKAGIRSVRSIEHPVAAAIGEGLPIEDALGRMVVDVGGGTTDIAVLALGSMVTSVGIESGIDDLDMAIRSFLYRKVDLVIDAPTAAKLRRTAAAAPVEQGSRTIEIHGRDARSGEASSAIVDPSELSARVERALESICDAAVEAISGAPPDLANDLLVSGLLLVGGGAYLPGLDRRLARATGVPVHVPNEPERAAVRGAARSEMHAEPSYELSSRSAG
jgi:rod shape-determining protein MreB